MDSALSFSRNVWYCIPSSEPIADSIRAQRITNASGSIAYLKKYADQIGAQLCIENLPRTCLGNTPEELLEIIKDTPGVKVCFDTNHYTKGTTGHFVETVGERIGTIHASDFDFVNECHWLPTQGDIQWGKLMHALEGIGYEGFSCMKLPKTMKTTIRVRHRNGWLRLSIK